MDTPRPNASDSHSRFNRLIDIGISLTSEHDLDVLLEKVVHYAREFTNADAGTLYLLQDGQLVFKIVQNSTLNVVQGGTEECNDLPPVPLDRSNVSAYAAIERKPINIADVYASDEYDFTGPAQYDATTGYRTQSMLVVPMVNNKGDVIGVLQLINALDPETGAVTVFPEELVDLVRSLASQAAAAISNAHMIEEIKTLFASLIRVLAVGVDAKSRYTSHHVERVSGLTLCLANAISDSKEGPFRDVLFTPEEIEELGMAAWLHDVGKVTTPVWIMDKSTKLETIGDRIELIKLRFELLKQYRRLKAEEARQPSCREDLCEADAAIDAELARELARLDEECAFIESCNKPGEFMSDERLERLTKAVAFSLPDDDGRGRPCVTAEELHYLSVRKGSLTDEEMGIMRDHVTWSRRLLDEVPFRGHLRNVPLYAGQHHEKLNGSGYPLGLSADEIPLQSRIIAVADLYEALSAKDRPYRDPTPKEKIFAIMSASAARGEIDQDIVDLMIRDRVDERFEAEYTEKVLA